MAMKSNPYLRVVGWGPLVLPGERRRLRDAATAAREIVEASSDVEVSKVGSGQVSAAGSTHAHDAMPSFGRTYRFRLKTNNVANCEIGFITGDILAVSTVDVWVNPENTDMEMDRHIGGSISSIIRYYGAKHGAAGRGTARVVSDNIANELNAKVGDARPVAPGTVFVTGSGNLRITNNVHYIIHVASVQGEPGVGFRSVQIPSLGQCVRNSLAEADLLARSHPNVRSILFPLLGTGMGKAAIGPAVSVLVESAISYLEASPDTALGAIYFLAYDSKEYLALRSALGNDPRLTPVEERGEIEAR
ncbi:MAG: macro domain-containing protein [Phycisphaerae bacterium]|nr:macro domain-containing protein [Phycisphaerae bacterium]